MSALRSPPSLVAAMLLVAALLALAMSFTEAINLRPELWRGPPDEYGHRSAARFYVDHWAPPKVGDPASLDSYSRDYGFSYLNDPDPVYFFAGKFGAVLGPVIGDQDRAFRLFNVLLLAALALVCLRNPAAWPVFVPVILSPQIWYICSYFNNDAFPLFLSVLIAWQLAAPDSAFNRYLDRPLALRTLGGALLFGLLVALLALSKKNYLGFLAFVPAAIALARLGAPSAVLLALGAIGGAALSQGWLVFEPGETRALAAAFALAILVAIFRDRATRRARAAAVAKLAILGIVAGAVVGSRFALDAAINDSPDVKFHELGVLQEKIAKPGYKPSQIYGGKSEATYYGIELRKRGTPLKDLFNPYWNWHNRTFASATGSYGWLTINAPFAYYALMSAAYLALMALYAWTAVRSREPLAATSVVLVAAFAALMLAVAIFHSWNNDFQAQGRYLFPIVGVLGIGLMMVQRWIPKAAFSGVVAACFALSVYSFVFIGLWNVQKSF